MDINNSEPGYNVFNLPYSPESEQSVLGAILIDSSCMDKIAEILKTPDYFYVPNHKLIYDAMLEMFISGMPIDYITVLDKLNSKDWDKNSCKTYLLQLAQIVPSISNVETYANIVKDKYNIRVLISTAREIIDEASSGENDAEEVLDSAEQKILDIRRGKNTQGLERIKGIVIREIDRLDMLYNQGSKEYSGIPTGIKDLDKVIMGLNRSDLILLAARPGMGKTSFALNIIEHVSVKEGLKAAFFSLEMTKEQLVSRMISMEGLIPGQTLRSGKLSDSEWFRLIDACEIIKNADIYIDDTPGITIPEIKSKLRRLNQVDLVVIDYLQLMSSAKRIENRVQEVSEITRNLKVMAKEFDVPLLTLSQLSRASEQRVDHKPLLSDLRDSGSIEQDADMVLFLYREGYYSPSEAADKGNLNSGECIVAKNRHGETRSVPLHWQGEFMKFTAKEVNRVEY